MHTADFNQLSEAEKRHFYKCGRCGEMVDMRQLDDVLFHENHVHRPDIQYEGMERPGVDGGKVRSMKSAQRLANRFGKTYHISYLRKRMERLRARDPEPLGSYEEWLIKVAEKRANKIPSEPSTADVANEELVVTLLLLENIDRPGLLGSAVLLLSRLSLDEKELASLAKQEHVDFLLSELRPRPPI